MSTLKSNVSIVPSELFVTTATQGTDLGALVTTGDGRYFRYVLNGAVAMVPGQVYQGPAQDTTNLNPSGGLSVAAAAVGATQITITSSITLTANQLSGAFMSVAVTPGAGQNLKVKSNTAVTSATGAVITLEDPLVTALTTSSKVVFQQNPHNGVVVAPATLTASAVGVSVYPIPAGQYGWIQTHGMASCLETGTGTCGTALGVLQGGTSGSLAPAVAGTAILAIAANTNVTGQYGNVFLVID